MTPVANTVYWTAGGSAPLQDAYVSFQHLFSFLCRQADAAAVVAKLAALPGVKSAAVVNHASSQPVMILTTDPTIGFWGCEGACYEPLATPANPASAQTNPLYIDTLADLIDRENAPNAFLDNNPTGPAGGPNLTITEITPGSYATGWHGAVIPGQPPNTNSSPIVFGMP